MLARLIVSVAVMVCQVQADVFRMPIHAVQEILLLKASQQDLASLKKRDNQAFLGGNALNGYSAFLPSSFIYQNSLFMMVELGLGTPPQSFHAVLSLKRPDLFVISKQCDDPMYKRRQNYDSADSSSYVENGTSVDVPFWNIQASGFISNDTITLGSAAVTGQNFVEATVIETSPANSNIYFDAVLGMGPGYGNSSAGLGNLASVFYSQGLMSKNIFSMVLPRALDELGEMAFGSTHSDTDLDDVVMLPVTTVTGDEGYAEFLTNSWQVSAEYVKLGSGDVINKTLDGFTAILETEFPLIGLPTDFVDRMHKYMGAKRMGWGLIYAFDCDVRETLEDLVFNLGGHEVRITPFDYTREYEDPVCISLLFDLGLQDDSKTPIIGLGIGFMLGVRTVFDLDKNMVGFIELLHRS